MPSPFISLDSKLKESMRIMRESISIFKPVAVYGLFSGGGDSNCAVDLASTLPEFTAAIHINTGIGVEEAREHARLVPKERGWPFIEMHPPRFLPPPERRDPRIDYENLPAYDAMVMHSGFPGPAGHKMMYTRLKERCIDKLVRLSKKKRTDKVLLISGVRMGESKRRMGNAVEMFRRGCACWCSPILYWSDADKDEYMMRRGLRKSEVSKRLCMSGECLCGSFAHPNELKEIEFWYPKTAERIKKLQQAVAALGRHAQWGTKPPVNVSKEVKKFNKEARDNPMCFSCHVKYEQACSLGDNILEEN